MNMKKMKQVKEHMKDINMKRLFRRNQIIITTLAVMIAAAGYLNYAGKKELADSNQVYEAGAMDISDEDILAENQAVLNSQNGGQLLEIPSLDDPDDGSGQVAQNGADGQLAAQNGADGEQLAQAGADGEQLAQGGADGQTTAPDGNGGQQAADADAQTGLENPGEAVLTSGMSVSDYIANVQLNREQIRAKNKETLMGLIDSTTIDDAAKQQAIQDMIDLTEVSEKENAAETLLMAKGFSDPVVSITKDKVDVVINAASITDPQRAQIEDIVKRKAEVAADQIIITLLNLAE
ncbi:SpoIIIAH-like family protein [Clostridium sp. AF18-27]|uniref:SpoIIIAH-like family protein n=1 Tax=Enterocloster TaxID=2719313 RepID=UPI000E53B149|nr:MULTISPECIES: SpoIIIAH-like family protein [Enterocloster]MCB6345893.1 SpoIIIAH-like family protein [Enterocloster lavalensis]MDR3755879.1 SpoIIIAH-like family protein [Enterocloster sp.]RHR50123.1 SpoIIIAH-like family protein [Clostridium sp. AF18-27]